MPASGARSGTRPSRLNRNAGDGSVGATRLACGHETHGEPIVYYPDGTRKWMCPVCCRLERKGRP